MTAEVAVLNKSAVALAADSAVTVSRGEQRKKTYNVEKLFTLSKYRPVGVMFYGAANLMGVPWETIVKEYRKHLGNGSFATVKGYADSFFRFIERSRHLFPEQIQNRFVAAAIRGTFSVIHHMGSQTIEAQLKKQPTISVSEINKFHANAIHTFHENTLSMPILKNLSEGYINKITKAFGNHVAHAKKEIFTERGIRISSASSLELQTIAMRIFINGKHPWSSTGVVIAGFGESQIYPEVITHDIAAVVEKRLLHAKDAGKSYPPVGLDIDPLMGHYTAVIAFAQTDVVQTIVEGISAAFRNDIEHRVTEMLSDSEELFGGFLTGVADAEKKRIQAAVRSFMNERMKKLREEVGVQIQKTHVIPLLEVIDALPKDELAAVAKAMVELTTIKRKMSLEMETVGGPVDVAVISKGDGFVWISRKHYFKPEMNMQFMQNYFREEN